MAWPNLRRLRVSSRLALIVVSFALPLATLLVLLVAGIRADIEFSRAELSGNAVERPLVDTLDALIRHEQAVLAGDATAREGAAARVDASLAALAAAVEAHGGGLALDREGLAKRGREHVLPQTLQSEWRTLRAAAASAGTTVTHAHLLADVRTLIQHVGDLSNLVLDPDLDSYYLMDVTLLALPQTLDRVARSLATARAATADGTVDAAERAALQVHAAMFQEADRQRIEASATTALQEDANFYGARPSLTSAMKPAVAAFSEANVAWEARLNALAAGEATAVDVATLDAAMASIQTGGALFRVAVAELDGLLETRVAALRGQQTADIGWTLLALVAALGLVWRISRSITRPLDVIVAALSESADDVSRASELLSHGSASLAHEAHQASASLEQASSALEEISATTASSADNARRAAETVNATRLAAEQGAADAEGMQRAMAAIKAAGDGIARILDTIDEIAFQTNILALNAAVEAARAGDAGLGFAVVADEVRNLARRSADAAHETSEKIRLSVGTSEEAMRAAAQVAKGLERILENAREADRLLGAIAQDAHEESLGLQQVTEAVAHLNSGTHANATRAEETSEHASELAGHAERLVRAVSALRPMVAGASPGGSGDDDAARPGTPARRDARDEAYDDAPIDADSLFGQDTPEPVYHRVGMGARA